MTDERRRGRAWKPDASGKRCLNCARPWGGHAARSCYPVPAPAIDAFASSRPDLLEVPDNATTTLTRPAPPPPDAP